MKTIIQFKSLAALMAAIGIAASASVANAKPVSAVIELFTSQGCSSCPPADALLQEFAKRGDVLALSMPVDYWDYLGWKDTLASPANSQRQRDYALLRGDRMVYTPQIVVNGIADAPGYDRNIINNKIEATNASLASEKVDLEVESSGEKLIVNVAAADDSAVNRSGTLWLLLFEAKVEVPIERGENAGRTIHYTNVVRQMTPVGTWNGEEAEFSLPKMDVMSRGHEGCAVLLQAGPTGPILGAAVLENW